MILRFKVDNIEKKQIFTVFFSKILLSLHTMCVLHRPCRLASSRFCKIRNSGMVGSTRAIYLSALSHYATKG